MTSDVDLSRMIKASRPDVVRGLREVATDSDLPPSRRLKSIDLLIPIACESADRPENRPVRDARQTLAQTLPFLRRIAHANPSNRIRSRASKLARKLTTIVEQW